MPLNTKVPICPCRLPEPIFKRKQFLFYHTISQEMATITVSCVAAFSVVSIQAFTWSYCALENMLHARGRPVACLCNCCFQFDRGQTILFVCPSYFVARYAELLHQRLLYACGASLRAIYKLKCRNLADAQILFIWSRFALFDLNYHFCLYIDWFRR